MTKDSSVKYCQKKGVKKKLVKGIKIFQKNKKQKATIWL